MPRNIAKQPKITHPMWQSLIYGVIIKHAMVVISCEIKYYVFQIVKHTGEFLTVIVYSSLKRKWA